MSDLAYDLAVYIAAQHASLTLAANTFASPVLPADSQVPAKAVFCLNTGGPAPQAYMGQVAEERFSRCQITVRGDAGEDRYEDGRVLAKRVLELAHRAPLAGYIDVMVQESEPNYLGPTEDGLPRWTINVIGWTSE